MNILRIAALFVVLATLGACTSTVPEKPSKALPTANTKSSTGLEDIEREKKDRDKSIKSFNSAFTDNSNWESSVRGTDGGPICQLRDQFNSMELAMGLIDGKYVSFVGTNTKITWSDVNIGEANARKKFRDTAFEYANELNRVLDINIATREKMGTCGSGEGSMDLVDTGQLMNNLLEALKSINSNASDLKTTPERLRARMLNEYITRLVIARQRPQDDPYNVNFRVSSLVNEAIYEWNFTAEQLKISAEELRTARDRG